MTTISMLMGLAPLPKKTVSGTQHVPEGSRAVRSGGAPAAVRQTAAARREAILEALRDGPMTALELAEETDASSSIIDEDLKILLAAEKIQKRKHKGENLYWMPSR
ncbi:winged helix-turn-helix domain-containing protein [Aromatoleum anaerobium]|uniref:ArsR family transcriptional regulator n=1 Tax=Aromatoleum anaerobium TaxID=182180 RepID=A0ABX1PPM8_9RHOO|nr:winged helix-turn-helix domain-containing protein [Aromatoleum anaerobium]MCK0507962.1 winged helix-turn-helix domain-containing protein [Aromatoleum anaerobium]